MCQIQIFLRITTRSELAAHHLDAEHGTLIYDHWLLDVVQMMDIAAVYGIVPVCWYLCFYNDMFICDIAYVFPFV